MKMRIRIFWVGKTRARYLIEGISHYLKLLGSLVKVSITEIKDERGKDRERALATEGTSILRQAESFILLDEKGTVFSSLEFAKFLEGKTSADFVLGGPYGVSEEIRANADSVISLSKMTFPHEMARVIFLEQLYRALTILKGKEYHH